MNQLNDALKTKKYEMVKEAILQDISAYGPGELAGTEMTYVKKLQVSRPTVRHAVNELIEEGVLIRRAGVGLQIPAQVKTPTSKKKLLIMINSLEDDDGLFSRIVLGAVDVANKKGFSYQIISNATEESKLKFLLDSDMTQFHGVITTAYDTYYDKKCLQFLQSKNIPVVLVDNPHSRGIYSYVVADDYAGGFMIGTHLAKLGHKRVLFILNSWPAQTTQNRLQGLRDGLAEYNVPLEDNDVYQTPFEADVHNYILEQAPKASFDYTAIACSNDMISMHIVNALDKLSIRVPEDISITGFGDYRIASMMRQPLTTVHVAGYKMGCEAARLILSYDLTQKTKKVIMDVRFVERGTTGPARQKR